MGAGGGAGDGAGGGAGDGAGGRAGAGGAAAVVETGVRLGIADGEVGVESLQPAAKPSARNTRKILLVGVGISLSILVSVLPGYARRGSEVAHAGGLRICAVN